MIYSLLTTHHRPWTDGTRMGRIVMIFHDWMNQSP